MTVDILVVAYCGWRPLADTLASLALWSEPGYRLTVFENSVKNYPLTWLWNRFFEQSPRDVVALCNPDVIVGPGWDAEALACFAQHPDSAAVSPLSNTAPHLETLGIPLPDTIAPADAETVAAELGRSGAGPRFHITRDERMAPGHCVLVRRRAWQQVGGFDERLAFGGNDFDFNRRLVNAGMTLGVATRTFSLHRWGASTADAVRLGQFDTAQNTPRFGHVPAGLRFDEL